MAICAAYFAILQMITLLRSHRQGLQKPVAEEEMKEAIQALNLNMVQAMMVYTKNLRVNQMWT